METTHEALEFDEPRARRHARMRADERMRIADELLKYVLVTTLLVVLVRPIGVLVGLIWGLGIVRRLYHREVSPKLRRRMVRREMRRACGRGQRGDDRPRRRRDRREVLAEQMGDDPRTRSALEWARGALDELDAADPEAGPPETVVRIADVVDEVVDAFEPEAERIGASFRVDVDADGDLPGDPARLKALLLDLVGESVRALADGACGPARIHVEMGENLAGSEVWVRIRDDRADAAGGARGTYGSRPVAGIPGAILETQASPTHGVERILTLRKQARKPARSAASHSEPNHAPTGDAA